MQLLQTRSEGTITITNNVSSQFTTTYQDCIYHLTVEKPHLVRVALIDIE